MKNISILLKLISFFILIFQIESSAQSGSLDFTFDNDGIVTTPIGLADDYPRSLVIQTDGKLVVAGYSFNGTHYDFAVVRYNADGSLDNSFDGDGKVTTSVSNSDNRAHSISLQNDGKLVVAGYFYNGTDNDFAVVRYNSDGSLDNSFDLDGIATTGFGLSTNDRSFASTIQADGKILVAGYNTAAATNRDFALVRYNTDGSLDNTFNSTGIVTTPLEIGGDEIRSIAIQTDGKIVVTGFCFDFVARKFALVRYNSNGSLDSTFDFDGILRTTVALNDDAAYAMGLQADGKIIAVGYTSNGTYDFAVVRYNVDGSLDNSFDSDGIAITSIGLSDDLPYSLAIQNDGKILVAGHSLNSDNNFALVRYNTNGILDNTFDTDGIVTTNIGVIGSDDIVQTMKLQTDGKIVVAGQTSTSSNYNFAVARYNNTVTSSINSINNESSGLKFYPNPFSKSTTLNTILKNATIEIYNSIGQQIIQVENISGQSFILERNEISNGLYYVHLIEANKTVSKAKILIVD